MNRQTANGSRTARGPARLAAGLALLLGAGAARAQIQAIHVPQDHLSPPGQHVHFKNVTVARRDATTATVEFDVSWGGSFRHEASHDAAWVFFKVRIEGEKEWQHVRLAADRVLNPTGYGQAEGGTPLDFMVPAGDDGFTGMFVRQADHGPVGPLAATGVTAVWDLTSNKGITQDTKVCVKAYGIKMVYVGEGPFYLGSGGDETYAFHTYAEAKKERSESYRITNSVSTIFVYDHSNRRTEFRPYRVTNAGAIPTGKQPGRLWARGAEPEDGGEIPASFPNGYAAFYCMAHPITASQYACFLNTLPPERAEAHYFGPGLPSGGAIIRSGEAPNYTYQYTHGRLKYVGIFNLSWADSAAWAAWACLRPSSELEYEKTLRGPREPARDEAAGSYWGMNFGGARYNGHPRERPVAVCNAVGRRFRGTHGLGTLTLPADWPRNDAVGVGFRGGDGDTGGLADMFARSWWCTSCRIDMATVDPERHVVYGFRGVRTAPPEAKQNSVRGEVEWSPLLLGEP